MITAYHRPESLSAALELLADTAGNTVPLGGGTKLNQPGGAPVAVVDLQALGLNQLEKRGKTLFLGATASLQALLDWPEMQPAFRQVLLAEASINQRQVATVAGSLVAADGRSAFSAALLALDATLTIEPGAEQLSIGTFLPARADQKPGNLITGVSLPALAALSYQAVARTPADLPIVAVAVAQWPSGRTRVVLAGYGSVPLLAMDGPEPQGAEQAARNAFYEAGDAWASAAYRSDVAATLTRRALADLSV